MSEQFTTLTVSSPGFDRATQYAAAYRLNRRLPGVLDRPLSRATTLNLIFR
jgi:hypothetical protein